MPFSFDWLESLLDQLNHEDRRKRCAACREMGALRDLRAVGPLVFRLEDTDNDVRQAAAEALRSLGEGRLASAVMGAWKGEWEAFEELARLVAQGDLRAIDPLIARVSDPDAAVRRAVGQALKRISKALKPVRAGLLCSSCWTRFEEKESAEGALWYACQVCGKAGKTLSGIRELVAVLDEEWSQERESNDGVLRVNWLERRVPFDFDRIEVIRASDYEVERFCIVVGNDTDEYRRARYKSMPWVVAPQCALSENTLRVLRSTFGPEGC
jgi:hypothetical protein